MTGTLKFVYISLVINDRFFSICFRVSTIIHLPIGIGDRTERLLTTKKRFATVKRPGFVLFCRIFETLSLLLESLNGKKTIKNTIFWMWWVV